MIKKRWYFTLTKTSGQTGVDLYLYKHKGKFKVDYYLCNNYLLNWWQAHWYYFLFNLPAWLHKNGEMFGYKKPTGRIRLQKLPNYMLCK